MTDKVDPQLRTFKDLKKYNYSKYILAMTKKKILTTNFEIYNKL